MFAAVFKSRAMPLYSLVGLMATAAPNFSDQKRRSILNE